MVSDSHRTFGQTYYCEGFRRSHDGSSLPSYETVIAFAKGLACAASFCAVESFSPHLSFSDILMKEEFFQREQFYAFILFTLV